MDGKLGDLNLDQEEIQLCWMVYKHTQTAYDTEIKILS